jgi:hypothetical protein
MLSDLLHLAWETRRRNFAASVRLVHPTKTTAVSLTDRSCGLNCAHCGGHYLEDMVTLEEARSLVDAGEATSLLISGGCSATGKVPFVPHAKELEGLSRHARLNFHVGLVDEEEAALVGSIASAVSFDFIGDDETIREVYGLSARVEDYLRSYAALRKHANVIPHICIGLRGGEISGERAAIRMLKAAGAGSLVFIVLIPTPGTLYAGVKPPALSEVASILAEARLEFPPLEVALGCMRPGGRYRRALDVLALYAGVNRIVNPTSQAARTAGYLGLSVQYGEECCVL